ncbi:MAG: hypothetical protein ACI4BA_07140 [Prevotella sp.]
MKRIISIAVLLLTLQAAYSQAVYGEIMSNAKSTAADKNASELARQVAQFKVDALDYLLIKMREQMPDSTATFLDKEAFALHNFVSFYISTIVESGKMPANYQIKIIKLFMDASYSNPLFCDPEHELTLSYYVRTDCFTRFSLDTDWRRANVAVMNEMQKLKENK